MGFGACNQRLQLVLVTAGAHQPQSRPDFGGSLRRRGRVLLVIDEHLRAGMADDVRHVGRRDARVERGEHCAANGTA